jgi:hypothetical protein
VLFVVKAAVGNLPRFERAHQVIVGHRCLRVPYKRTGVAAGRPSPL